MRKHLIASLFTTCIASVCVLAETTRTEQELASLRLGLQALPAAPVPTNPAEEAKIALGKKLYTDTILSRAKDLSCNSCHKLDSYGVDNQPTSTGDKGQKGGRNSPTSFNAALHIAQFWDGRAGTVEEQALGPIQNPVEMAMPVGGAEVVDRLKAETAYVTLFAQAYPDAKDPVTFAHVGDAIGAFERTLITPSRFDAFVAGDTTALTNEELTGLERFKSVGCMACHSGATLGGQMYQKLGLVTPYETKDLGRYEVTKLEQDKFVFKVPSLRNIEKTAPYFHDGSVATLDQAVQLMGRHQLGRELSSEDTTAIVTFLKSLTAPKAP